MSRDDRKSHLVTRNSRESNVCTYCTSLIEPDSLFYLEKGNQEHIHSLIARRFCTECYAKYGEQRLLQGKK